MKFHGKGMEVVSIISHRWSESQRLKKAEQPIWKGIKIFNIDQFEYAPETAPGPVKMVFITDVPEYSLFYHRPPNRPPPSFRLPAH